MSTGPRPLGLLSSFDYQASEGWYLTSRFGYTTSQIDGQPDPNTIIPINIGIRYFRNEKFEIEALAGYSLVDTEAVFGSAIQTYDITAIYMPTARLRIEGTYGRSVQLGNLLFGTGSTTESYGIRVQRLLGKKMSASFGYSSSSAMQLDERENILTAIAGNLEQTSMQFGLRCQLGRNLNMGLSYVRVMSAAGGIGAALSQNQIGITSTIRF